MGVFVSKTTVKSASLELATPIADLTAFDTIVDGIVTNNPFTCTTYTVSGEVQAAVAITKRSYGAALIWKNAEAKRCGSTSDKYSTKAGFDAGVAVLMGSAPCATAHAGTIIHDPERDTFSAPFRCQMRTARTTPSPSAVK